VFGVVICNNVVVARLAVQGTERSERGDVVCSQIRGSVCEECNTHSKHDWR